MSRRVLISLASARAACQLLVRRSFRGEHRGLDEASGAGDPTIGPRPDSGEDRGARRERPGGDCWFDLRGLAERSALEYAKRRMSTIGERSRIMEQKKLVLTAVIAGISVGSSYAQ